MYEHSIEREDPWGCGRSPWMFRPAPGSRRPVRFGNGSRRIGEISFPRMIGLSGLSAQTRGHGVPILLLELGGGSV